MRRLRVRGLADGRPAPEVRTRGSVEARVMAYFANGTEGSIFEHNWCARCVHNDFTHGKEPGVDPPCPVWMAHLLYNYDLCNEKDHPGKVILDMLITEEWVEAPDGHEYPKRECKMFVEAGEE
jgi:hypothetical protein